MNIRKTGIQLCMIGLAWNGLAWNSVESFESAATNALNNVQILVGADFGCELTNYIAATTDHASKMSALMVLGERYLATYNETMDERNLRNAWVIATNVCSLTSAETNMWYCWQAQLLKFACHAQNNEIQLAYDVSSNACSQVGSHDFSSSNLVSVALLKRNKTPDLSVGQALMLSHSLAAVLIGRKIEAENIASTLPLKYQAMVDRAAADDN